MSPETIQVLTFVAEVGIFAGIYYYLLRFFHGTRGAQALTGFLIFYGALWVISHFLNRFGAHSPTSARTASSPPGARVSVSRWTISSMR